MMATLKFGNWQSFLDEQTKHIPVVEDIVKDRTTEDIFMKILQHDMLKSCQWISDYFQTVSHTKKTGLKNEKLANTYRSRGNLAFKKKNYDAALEEYNNAIRTAFHHPEADTEDSSSVTLSELALSYANRSAVYLHMTMYQECLSDIQAALISGYPSSLRCKLYTRQTLCYIRLSNRGQAEKSIQEAQRFVQELDTPKQESVLEEISKLKTDVEKLDSGISESHLAEECPVPLRGFHSVVTQASSALDLKYNEDEGRHLVANCDIEAGEVLIIEKPYASVLLPDFYHSHCHHCYARLTVFYPCRECLRVKYCSVQCQSEAWSVYHSVECPYQDLLHSVGIAHLSLRVVLTAGISDLMEFKDKIEDKSCLNVDILGLTEEGRYERNYLSVYALMPHTENLQPEDLTQYALTARLLLYVLENSGYFESVLRHSEHQPSTSHTFGELAQGMQHLSVSGDSSRDTRELKTVKVYIGSLLLRHICQLVCNAHAITEMQLTKGDISEVVDTQSQERIATAIYPTTSLLNHSCKPTIINSFIKNLLVVRAIKSVNTGEQIYNCYGPHSARMDLRERQASLKSQYFFTCHCEACEDQGKLEALYTAVTCEKCTGPVPVTGQFEGTCLECGQHVFSLPDVLAKVTEDQKAFVSAVQLMESGRLKDCLRMLLPLLKAQSKSLYMYNRDLSQTQDALAKCYAMAGDYEQAVVYLAQAMTITEVIYGKDSIEAGYELQKYAELLLRAGQKEACFKATQRAVAIFKLYYGKEHAILDELSKVMLVARYS